MTVKECKPKNTTGVERTISNRERERKEHTRQEDKNNTWDAKDLCGLYGCRGHSKWLQEGVEACIERDLNPPLSYCKRVSVGLPKCEVVVLARTLPG